MSDPADAGSRRVVLHIGTPKSGTTYVQRQMNLNRERLRRAGYLYPAHQPSHFLHVMDLRGRGFHGHEYPGMDGAWERLCAEVRAFRGPALISHEMMGGLHDEGIERAARSFPGRDVRVVVTCRDLGRQLPALWQERVKNGATMPYQQYLRRAEKSWQGVDSAGMPWAGQNLALIGRRWGEVVGPENVVFVIVPGSGAEPGELWRRFAVAAGLEGLDVRLDDDASNTSMGTAEVELLRRVNERLPDDLPWPDHSRLVKMRFAQRRLAGRRAAGALTVPEERREVFEAISAEMIDQLGRGGHGVVGDLAELQPSFRDGTTPEPMSDSVIADVAVEQVVNLLMAGRKDLDRNRAGAVPVDPASDGDGSGDGDEGGSGQRARAGARSLPRRAARRASRRFPRAARRIRARLPGA